MTLVTLERGNELWHCMRMCWAHEQGRLIRQKLARSGYHLVFPNNTVTIAAYEQQGTHEDKSAGVFVSLDERCINVHGVGRIHRCQSLRFDIWRDAQCPAGLADQQHAHASPTHHDTSPLPDPAL